MYIKYDESELFEFFECEPVPVGDDDAGDLIFTYSDNEFKLILFFAWRGRSHPCEAYFYKNPSGLSDVL